MADSKNVLNFDQLYSQMCDSLKKLKKTEDILARIKKCKTDWDRVQLILVEDQKITQLFAENIMEMFETKNESKSRELFETFCNNDGTIEVLNKALRLCPLDENDIELFDGLEEINDIDSVQMFIDYPNYPLKDTDNQNLLSKIFYERSKLLYKKSLFEDCVRDTFRSIKRGHIKLYDMAFRLGDSYKNLGLLNESKMFLQHALFLLRQSNSDNEYKSKETISIVKSLKDIQELEKSKDSKKKTYRSRLIEPDLELFGVFQKPNKLLKGTTDAVRLKFNSEIGRHVIALKPIPVGSTVIMESPYAWSLAVKEYHLFCQFCMNVTYSGIPCTTCSTVITCGSSCHSKIKALHNFECKILKLLDSSEKLGQMAVLCFRTIVKTPLSTLLQEYHASCDENPEVNSSLGIDKRKGILDSSNYSSAFAQTTNSETRSSADLLKRTYAAVYLTMCLRFVGYFGPVKQDDPYLSENEQKVAAILLRHLQSVSCNAYGINYFSIQDDSKHLETKEIGGATYPVISTTNHSCNPNVYRFNVGKTCIVKATQEIPEGGEILDSYGPLFSISPLDERTHDLKNQYLFSCRCEACINNWPPFVELRSPEYKNSYKCSHCSKGKFAIDKENSSNKQRRNCPLCGKTTDIKNLLKLLRAAEEKYLLSKKSVLENGTLLGSDRTIEESITNYISVVQKNYVLPCKEMVEAQEVLKLYWSLRARYLLGNSYDQAMCLKSSGV